MKTNLILSILALLLLVGCDYNDKYFDGLDDLTKPSDVKAIEYTLLDGDYSTISSNSTNKKIAEALEAEGKMGVVKELANLGTTKRFSDILEVSEFAPAFIAGKWYTADDGSSVKLTYNKFVNVSQSVQELNTSTIYKVTAADYTSIWGEDSSVNFFTPATPASSNIPKILTAALPDAKEGSIVAVDYNESENEPSGVVVVLNEDFSDIVTTTGVPVSLDGWHNVTTIGSLGWEGRYYATEDNSYLNATANNAAGELEIYMITPKITVTQGLNLSFDACYGYYRTEGGRLSVLVSSDLGGFTATDINTAQWDDITSSFHIEIPTGNFGTLTPTGTHNLDAYTGKDIYIAFKYYGNKLTDATTTVQVDNVVVKSEPGSGGEDKYIATSSLFQFNGTAWTAYSENAYLLTLADFQSMGQRYDNFTSSVNADNYLPTFLKLKYPYAQIEDQIGVAYKYYDDGTTIIMADEYSYSGTEWVKNNGIEIMTDQFVLSSGKWNYDPSVVITLSTTKNDPISTPFYQTITDWVKANHEEFVTSYGNNDYYYGGSAYNNNFDFRPSAWRGQSMSAYGAMSDAELTNLMFERLPESFPHALEVLYSDADLVEGIEVIYTINFSIYDGNTTTPYTIQYLVVGKGKFEYIEDSLKKNA